MQVTAVDIMEPLPESNNQNFSCKKLLHTLDGSFCYSKSGSYSYTEVCIFDLEFLNCYTQIRGNNLKARIVQNFKELQNMDNRLLSIV